MKFTSLVPLTFLALTGASPCSQGPSDSTVTITPEQIIAIAPKSESCDGAVDFVSECGTAEQAAPAVSEAFTKYGLTNKAEQAAVLGLMAMESGEFRYNKNHWPEPGTVGKGTRNMQSVDFNKLYAASILEIADEFAKVQDQPGPVLDLLLQDPVLDYGSGAWFLTTQCNETVRSGLQNNGEEGWKAFITGCVVTEADEARRGYWSSAVTALGA
ncbi:uncharacterized protein DSM5745_04276 [Aspergillus mulundensis]|uniref:Uncharacterized protein n=1 Tax=Aspergillus mulundensis TaxID=1810919 RepID=A0A3D8SC90_9EURO|nr:Uncharacterized protein DSM5745_04276 [Aspergillus mulundensis]RDW83950.1 Uncharacterized protein DSM5745_04276 [Aspergillus mulundensis]